MALLPLVLLYSVFALLETTQALVIRSAATPGTWRADLRRRGLPDELALSTRPVLEGIVKGEQPLHNSTIVPLVLGSDKQTYFTILDIGKVTLRVALDTASADFWVASSACWTERCNGLPRYPLAFHSPTFSSIESNTTSFSVTYADLTSAHGFVARETLQISNLTVPDQVFGLASIVDVKLVDRVSGILGLGFNRLSAIASSVTGATSFFGNVAANGLLDYPLFGVSLTRNTSGTLALGAIDSTVVTDRTLIEWSDVVPFSPFGKESNTSSYLQWAIVLDGISVGDKKIAPQPTYPAQTSKTSLALIDVGAAGIFGPFQDVARMFEAIDGARLVDDAAGQWVVPCDIAQTLAFNFGGHDLIMQPTDYLIGPASGNPNLCLSWPRALPPSADGIDWQFGSPFLRTVYSIFSFGIDTKEAPMIGFYPLRNASAPIEDAAQVSSFLSSQSATVQTTLPNALLTTPTPSVPAYTLFNTSVPAGAPGKIVSTALATSTYTALLGKGRNVSALPIITPMPTLQTFIITDANGNTRTEVSTRDPLTAVLGAPPGWESGAAVSTRLGRMGWLASAFALAVAVIV